MPKKVVSVLTFGGIAAVATFFFKRSLLKWVLIGTAATAGFFWYKGRS